MEEGHVLKLSPNIGKPLFDSSLVTSSWITSQCSRRRPSSMRRMSAAIQFAGRKPENRPWTGGRFQADSFHQFVEILDYALIEAVDLRSPFLFQLAVTCDGAKLPDRISRLGRTSRAHNPAIIRSDTRRFGARRRERFKISNWCLSRTDSARTDLTPPGRARRIEVARTWTNKRMRSRIPNPTRKSKEADWWPPLLIRQGQGSLKRRNHPCRRVMMTTSRGVKIRTGNQSPAPAETSRDAPPFSNGPWT